MEERNGGKMGKRNGELREKCDTSIGETDNEWGKGRQRERERES